LYPAGRIEQDPAAQKRRHAVRYADFALGQFIANARSHAFFDHTLFVILGDHGARVYGEQDIPLPSYEIPLLIYGQGFIAPERDDRMASQLDVAPTILGLLNIGYDSQFFGRDLRRVPEQKRFAFLSHNRDVAMLHDNHLAVLSMQRQERLWQVRRQDGYSLALDLDRDQNLVRDTVAFYQVAYHQFSEKKLHPLPQNSYILASNLTHVKSQH
jgi:arylsulfatase A-like enzyme